MMKVTLSPGDFEQTIFFGTVLSKYQILLGMNQGEMADILPGCSGSYFSQLRRHLLMPPKPGRKLRTWAEAIARVMQERNLTSAIDCGELTEQIYEEFVSARENTEKWRIGEAGLKIALRTLSLFITGDAENWRMIHQLIKGSDSVGDFWQRVATLRPDSVSVKLE